MVFDGQIKAPSAVIVPPSAYNGWLNITGFQREEVNAGLTVDSRKKN
jgi:hypothetical protein